MPSQPLPCCWANAGHIEMVSINRVDQAVLLLRERLERLAMRRGMASNRSASPTRPDMIDPLSAVRTLGDRGTFTQAEIRRALVKALLADALGSKLATTLEFQALSDQVADILEDSTAGQALLARAIKELG